MSSFATRGANLFHEDRPDNIDWIKIGSKNAPLFSDRKIQKLFNSDTLRITFSLCVPITITISTVLSVVLLLVGIFFDHRPCLTGGCILGLATFGAMLHGCLSHRTLPDSPIVLRAACMYPVGNIALATNPNAAAAAMATASLLPRSFKRTSSFMAASLEANLFNQLSRNPSLSLATGPGHSAPNMEAIPFPYDRQVSEPVTRQTCHSREHELYGSSSNTGPTFVKQHSCPVGRVTLPSASDGDHLYVNDLQLTGFSAVPQSVPSLSKVQVLDESMNSETVGKIRNSNGAADSPKPRVQRASSDKVPSSIRFSVGPTHEQLKGITSFKPHPNTHILRDVTHDTTTSPQLNLSTMRRVIQPVSFNHRPDEYPSRDILRFLSHCETGDYSYRLGRRYNRERDGIFGPRVWRGWRSWIDP